MDRRIWLPAALLAAFGVAVAAPAQWSGAGWGDGYGNAMGFGRTEGPVSADLWTVEGGYSVYVTVQGCGGVRDYRGFGTEIVGGDGEVAEAESALARMLGEARRVCNFEERLATRMVQGFQPAFAAWIEEQAAMYAEMNMAIDMNAIDDCPDCNAM